MPDGKVKSLLRLICLSLMLLSAMLSGAFPSIILANGSSPPLAAFTYNPCVLCAVPGYLVSFQGNWSLAPSGKNLNYTWNFGDGTAQVTTTSPYVSHAYYGAPGQWLVSLTVKDSNGLTDTVSQLVLFYVAPRFAFRPADPFVGQPVTFNASSSISYESGTNPITGYSWSFGDGTIGSGALATHSYSASGPYRIVLTLRTVSGDPSISKTFVVGQIGSVGGQALAINKLALLLPYIAVASIIMPAYLGGLYGLRRKRESSASHSGQ